MHCSKHWRWGFSVFYRKTIGGFTTWLELLDVLGLLRKYSNWLRTMDKKQFLLRLESLQLERKSLLFDLLFYKPSRFMSALKLHSTFLRVM